MSQSHDRKTRTVWSPKAKLVLVSAVVRHGEQSWMTVSRTVRNIMKCVTDDDYSQKQCALQYEALLKEYSDSSLNNIDDGEPAPVKMERRLIYEQLDELSKSIQATVPQILKLQAEKNELDNADDETVLKMYQRMKENGELDEINEEGQNVEVLVSNNENIWQSSGSPVCGVVQAQKANNEFCSNDSSYLEEKPEELDEVNEIVSSKKAKLDTINHNDSNAYPLHSASDDTVMISNDISVASSKEDESEYVNIHEKLLAEFGSCCENRGIREELEGNAFVNHMDKIRTTSAAVEKQSTDVSTLNVVPAQNREEYITTPTDNDIGGIDSVHLKHSDNMVAVGCDIVIGHSGANNALHECAKSSGEETGDVTIFSDENKIEDLALVENTSKLQTESLLDDTTQSECEELFQGTDTDRIMPSARLNPLVENKLYQSNIIETKSAICNDFVVENSVDDVKALNVSDSCVALHDNENFNFNTIEAKSTAKVSSIENDGTDKNFLEDIHKSNSGSPKQCEQEKSQTVFSGVENLIEDRKILQSSKHRNFVGIERKRLRKRRSIIYKHRGSRKKRAVREHEMQNALNSFMINEKNLTENTFISDDFEIDQKTTQHVRSCSSTKGPNLPLDPDYQIDAKSTIPRKIEHSTPHKKSRIKGRPSCRAPHQKSEGADNAQSSNALSLCTQGVPVVKLIPLEYALPRVRSSIASSSFEYLNSLLYPRKALESHKEHTDGVTACIDVSISAVSDVQFKDSVESDTAGGGECDDNKVIAVTGDDVLEERCKQNTMENDDSRQSSVETYREKDITDDFLNSQSSNDSSVPLNETFDSFENFIDADTQIQRFISAIERDNPLDLSNSAQLFNDTPYELNEKYQSESDLINLKSVRLFEIDNNARSETESNLGVSNELLSNVMTDSSPLDITDNPSTESEVDISKPIAASPAVLQESVLVTENEMSSNSDHISQNENDISCSHSKQIGSPLDAGSHNFEQSYESPIIVQSDNTRNDEYSREESLIVEMANKNADELAPSRETEVFAVKEESLVPMTEEIYENELFAVSADVLCSIQNIIDNNAQCNEFATDVHTNFSDIISADDLKNAEITQKPTVSIADSEPELIPDENDVMKGNEVEISLMDDSKNESMDDSLDVSLNERRLSESDFKNESLSFNGDDSLTESIIDNESSDGKNSNLYCQFKAESSDDVGETIADLVRAANASRIACTKRKVFIACDFENAKFKSEVDDVKEEFNIKIKKETEESVTKTSRKRRTIMARSRTKNNTASSPSTEDFKSRLRFSSFEKDKKIIALKIEHDDITELSDSRKCLGATRKCKSDKSSIKKPPDETHLTRLNTSLDHSVFRCTRSRISSVTEASDIFEHIELSSSEKEPSPIAKVSSNDPASRQRKYSSNSSKRETFTSSKSRMSTKNSTEPRFVPRKLRFKREETQPEKPLPAFSNSDVADFGASISESTQQNINRKHNVLLRNLQQMQPEPGKAKGSIINRSDSAMHYDEKIRQNRKESLCNKPADSEPCSNALSIYCTEESSVTSATLKEYQTWKKAVMLVWQNCLNARNSSIFLHPVKEDNAPDYFDLILSPMDLSQIKRNIESGVIRSTVHLQRDVMLLVANAIMYNASTHDIYVEALKFYADIMRNIEMLDGSIKGVSDIRNLISRFDSSYEKQSELSSRRRKNSIPKESPISSKRCKRDQTSDESHKRT